MKVEVYCMPEFKDLIRSLTEPLLDLYTCEKPIRICSGSYLINNEGEIRQIGRFKKLSAKLRGEFGWFAAHKSKHSRKGKQSEALARMRQIQKIAAPFSYKETKGKRPWGSYDPNYGAIVIDLGNLAIAFLDSEYIRNKSRVDQLEATIGHELVHKDTDQAIYNRERRRFKDKIGPAISTKQIYNSAKGYSSESNLSKHQQRSMEEAKEILQKGKIEGTELEGMNEHEVEHLRLLCFHNGLDYTVLDESIAYAVQETLFPGVNPPDFEANFPDSVEYQKAFEDTYFAIREMIGNRGLIKSTIKEVIGVMNQAYEEERSPLEVLGTL